MRRAEAARAAGIRGLAVVEIVLMLAAAVTLVAFLVGWRQQASTWRARDAARTLLEEYDEALIEWRVLHPRRECPRTVEELRGQGLIAAPPVDPWGRRLVYHCPGSVSGGSWDLLSAGPDRREGTPDDVRGWE